MSNGKKIIVIQPKSVPYTEQSVYLPFLKNDESPFNDLYNLNKEAVLLDELIALDELEMSHPKYLQWLEYKKHERVLKEYILSGKAMKNGPKFKNIKNINLDKYEIVPNDQAVFKRIGTLRNKAGDTDTLSLHIVNSFKLWNGGYRNDGKSKKYASMIHAIGAVRKILFFSKDFNNPYADLYLLEIEKKVSEIKNEMKQAVVKTNEMLDEQKKIGLELNIMVSKEPLKIELNFDTPYGHMFVQLLGQFDFMARSLKTLQGKAIISQDEAHKEIFKFVGKIRALIELTHELYSALIPIKNSISRDLLLSELSEDDKELIKVIAESYGKIPYDVLINKKKPNHVHNATIYSESEIETIIKNAKQLGLVNMKNDNKG